MSKTRVRVNKMKLRFALILMGILRLAAYASAWLSLLPQMLRGSVQEPEDGRWRDARNL
ncbi:hypothetical protein ACHHV8_01925 [Paenibacillus sp. TAB 01]|uniref:hypothetical protein n=1 Tax=Paenibacillus sp. TAB 01 TaxID=3368988 RepID=UPI0037527F43